MEPLPNCRMVLECDRDAMIDVGRSGSRSAPLAGEGRSDGQCKCNACVCKSEIESIWSNLVRGQDLHEGLRAWGGYGAARLQKLVRAELAFLNRLVAVQLRDNPVSVAPALRSSNLDHVENVFRILQHRQISGVSGVMQRLTLSENDDGKPQPVHVDIACLIDGQPAWLIVSSRNPKHVRWSDAGSKKHGDGVRERLLRLLEAAHADAAKTPRSIFLCFGGQLPEAVDQGLKAEFNAIHLPCRGGEVEVEEKEEGIEEDIRCPKIVNSCILLEECKVSEVDLGEWIYVDLRKDVAPWNAPWEAYQINLGIPKKQALDFVEPGTQSSKAVSSIQIGHVDGKHVSPSSILPLQGDRVSNSATSPDSAIRPPEGIPSSEGCTRMINLDTTALVALVSEITNGGAESLLTMTQEAMEKRFRNMSSFIREQTLSELDRPLAREIEEAMACCQVVVSQHAHDEFMSIVSQIAGPREKGRAKALLRRVRAVADTPSARVMSLPVSGRIKQRHRIIFGTGDCLNAPTLTANMAFVRAARTQGVAIAAVEHRPRALTGD